MRSRSRMLGKIAWLGMILLAKNSWGQVVEQDTRVTGPRGRTIERSVRTERGPGFVDRQVEIKRPHETLIRDTRIVQPGGFGPRPLYPLGPPRRQFVERDVIVEQNVVVQRAPIVAPFVAPFLSFSFGGGPPPPPPPPPVYVVPEPVFIEGPEYVATPPVIVGGPAYSQVQQVPAPIVQPGPPISPQLADALGRLSSFHHQSRRDGCLTLGHLDDPRAVGPLIDRLDHDLDREVRTAAAWSLGEIADPRAAVSLERAALYDKRQEVRDAANAAYRKLPRPGQPTTISGPVASPSKVAQSAPIQSNQVVIDPGPPPEGSSDLPPPLPTPPGGGD